MAGRGDIQAGKAYVTIYAKSEQLLRGLQNAMNTVRRLGTQMTQFGQGTMRVGAQVAGLGIAMTAAFAAPVKAASDLMETTSKFEAVFGEGTPAATAWLNDFTEAVGRGKAEAMNGMSAFQAFFTGMGMGSEEAAGFSKELTALAVDFGSFHNMQDPEAMQRFISALSGSGEVLSMYGVNIMEAALNQKMLAMGFPTISQGATETQKVLARMAIIKESMGAQGAIGDAIRTSGSFSNQLKRLNGVVMDTAAEIGSALLPAITPLVAKIAEVVKMVGGWAKQNAEIVATIAKVAAGVAVAGGVILAIGATITALGSALGGIVALIGGIGTAVAMVASPVGLIVATLVGGVTAWALWTESGQSAMRAIASAIEPIRQVWQGVVDALMAGDLALAGKVAMAGLRLAFLEGVNLLTQSLGSYGTILAQLLTGDLQGAWDTTLLKMGNLWDVFATTLMATFKAATDKIRSMLVGITAGINASMVAMEAYLKSIGQTSLAQSVGAARTTITQASAGADVQLGAISSTADALADALQTRMERSAAELGSEVGAQDLQRDAELEAARKELDDAIKAAGNLRKQRAEGAAGEGGQGAESSPSINPPNVEAMRGKTFGTFSSAALMTMSNGGQSMQAKMLAAQKQLLAQQEKAAAEQRTRDEKITRLLERGQLMQVAGEIG